jgi:RND superfamily putative drug exporter
MSGPWSRVASLVGRHPLRVVTACTVALVAAAALVPALKADGLGSLDSFTHQPDSVIGQKRLAQHFPAGTSTPTIVLARQAALQPVLAAVRATAGVVSAQPFRGSDPAHPSTVPKVVNGLVRIDATLADSADSKAAYATVDRLRTAVHRIPGAEALVGGASAINADVQSASRRDRNVIIPIILVVIFVVLMLLLRALVAPILLIATVVLSFLATMGVCSLLFRWFHFAGADNAFPLFSFVFLVALGIDYNIFLMTRVREESQRIGTPAGILKGLTVTGGVITSAGVVLAATFTVLGILPLVSIAEIGIAVAFGVLLDTIAVRSLLVPAAAERLGSRIWWPSALSRPTEP